MLQCSGIGACRRHSLLVDLPNSGKRQLLLRLLVTHVLLREKITRFLFSRRLELGFSVDCFVSRMRYTARLLFVGGCGGSVDHI